MSPEELRVRGTACETSSEIRAGLDLGDEKQVIKLGTMGKRSPVGVGMVCLTGEEGISGWTGVICTLGTVAGAWIGDDSGLDTCISRWARKEGEDFLSCGESSSTIGQRCVHERERERMQTCC